MTMEEILNVISSGEHDEGIHLIVRAARDRLRQVQERDYRLLEVGDEVEIVGDTRPFPADGARGTVVRINQRHPLPVAVRLHGQSRESFADQFSLKRLPSAPEGDAVH
jgi:hypothetical protein